MPSMPDVTPLPGKTAALFDSLMRSNAAACHPNFALLRFVRWYPGWSPTSPDRSDRSAATVKDTAFKAAAAAASSEVLRRLAAHVATRRQAWVAPMHASGIARVLKLRALTPLAVGLSSPGPLELGMAFHHVYGYPVLPASGLKGLAHAARGREAGRDLYGEIDSAGQVDFLEGVPLSWQVRRDIMTPHHPGWYGQGRGNSVPNDTDNPVPISFLSIDVGAEFEVVLLATRAADPASLLDQAEEDLRRGIEERGFGAKTAAGYGYFDVTRVEPSADDMSSERTTARATVVPGSARTEFDDKMTMLRALKADAGNIGVFVDWCLALAEPPEQQAVASVIVEKMGRKWVKDKAKSKEKWKQVLDLAEASTSPASGS